MTIIEMINQGSIIDLAGMIIMFILMIFMISAIGRGVMLRDSGDKKKQVVSSPGRAGNSGEITAAITAAVSEYRKNK